MADYNLMKPDEMDELLFSPFRQALGEKTVERMGTQIENYDYYSGKQHRDDNGALVKADELERPAGVDYDPTRYATNYFKAIVDRKARWQMGGRHGIAVPRQQIDDSEDVLQSEYEPSEAQRKENERAEGYERLLYTLWDENKMRARLIQAARDRLIADRVVCKISFNPRTGKLRWIWVPDYEYIPIYSDDDFQDLVAAIFVKGRTYEVNGEDVPALQIQRYELDENYEFCTFEDVIYSEEDLSVLETVTPKGSLGLDFIPVQEFPVNELITETLGESEIKDMREQNDILNQMNEDAIDSLKFEMFEITAITNAATGAADGVELAPGALVEIQSQGDTKSADIKKVHGNFAWKEAFKDQYMRVKGAMHEISGLPQIVPQELNFGGLNGEALQVLFHDIITDTEEHWLSWGYNLAELHEKSIRYLQARIAESNFAYDKDVLRAIGEEYTNEIRFVLPLPDNRKELVELLEMETVAGFESTKGAMERLGVENVQSKTHEIESERSRRRSSSVASYGEEVETLDDE